MEWSESEGSVNRTYLGLGKRSVGVVQFETTRNRFLAAGDEFSVKFWDMDNVNPLFTVDAEGGLPVIVVQFLVFSLPLQFMNSTFLLAVWILSNFSRLLHV